MKNKILNFLENKYTFPALMFFVGFFYKDFSPNTSIKEDIITLFFITLVIFFIKEIVIRFLKKGK